MPISITNLATPAGGYFFRPTANLDAASIEKLFDDIKKQWAKGTPVVRDVRRQRTTAGTQYSYSFLCIKMKPSEPPFLPKSGLIETRYGFVLLIEIAGLLGLFKRGPTGFEDWLDANCDRIGAHQLTRVYESTAVYGKISLRRMTVSRQELRACSYEAANLATTIPALGLGRSVPRFIRLSHPTANKSTETVSIVPATSRITKSGKKLSVDDLAKVVSEIAGQMANPAGHGFLDVFPLPLAISALPAGVQPTSVLFDLSDLDESISQTAGHVFLRRAGKPDQDVTNTVKRRFEEILPLSGQASPYSFGRMVAG